MDMLTLAPDLSKAAHAAFMQAMKPCNMVSLRIECIRIHLLQHDAISGADSVAVPLFGTQVGSAWSDPEQEGFSCAPNDHLLQHMKALVWAAAHGAKVPDNVKMVSSQQRASVRYLST